MATNPSLHPTRDSARCRYLLEFQAVEPGLLHLDAQGDRLAVADAQVVTAVPPDGGPGLVADDRDAVGQAAALHARDLDLDPAGAECQGVNLQPAAGGHH